MQKTDNKDVFISRCSPNGQTDDQICSMTEGTVSVGIVIVPPRAEATGVAFSTLLVPVSGDRTLRDVHEIVTALDSVFPASPPAVECRGANALITLQYSPEALGTDKVILASEVPDRSSEMEWEVVENYMSCSTSDSVFSLIG